MAALNDEKLKILTYETTRFDFEGSVKEALGLHSTEQLSQIHTRFNSGPVVTRETDSTTPIHRLYYEKIADTNFYNHYRDFIHTVVSRVVEGPLIVQRIPTFRAHMPKNKAVGRYHRDKEFGHQDGAINFWLPVTRAHHTNALHIDLEDDWGPVPLELEVGEFLAFDGVNLRHGNELNETSETRVSFDFRVIPEVDYIESSERSVNTLSRLALGDYYVHADEL